MAAAPPLWFLELRRKRRKFASFSRHFLAGREKKYVDRREDGKCVFRGYTYHNSRTETNQHISVSNNVQSSRSAPDQTRPIYIGCVYVIVDWDPVKFQSMEIISYKLLEPHTSNPINIFFRPIPRTYILDFHGLALGARWFATLMGHKRFLSFFFQFVFFISVHVILHFLFFSIAFLFFEIICFFNSVISIKSLMNNYFLAMWTLNIFLTSWNIFLNRTTFF